MLFPRMLPALGLASSAAAAGIQKITAKLDNNPTNVGFYIVVPDSLPPNPPVVVNPHWCHGSAMAAYSGSQFATLAAKLGYIVIYPDSPNTSDKCWDISSHASLTHGAGGDSLGIVSMVNYTLATYKADPRRVFVTGVSSGAMMTSNLVAAYPDVFAAGSAFSGVPYGCFAAPADRPTTADYWSDACATGKLSKPAAAWADLVRGAYVGYSGWRPKMQIFHGTVDETLNYACFTEEVKQWNAVFGFDNATSKVTQNTPLRGWTKTAYGPDGWFEAYSAAGVPHNIPVQEAVTVAWFDLACTGSDCFQWGRGGPLNTTGKM